MQELLEGSFIKEESDLIKEMLQVEENACQILDEAKEKGNRMIIRAREGKQALMEETKKELEEYRTSLKKRLLSEGEERVAQIALEKEKTWQRIEEQVFQQRERVLQEIREMLFGDL